MITSLKKNLGIRNYESERSANLEIGANKFDVISNYRGNLDGISVTAVSGGVTHEAYITDTGDPYIVDSGTVATNTAPGSGGSWSAIATSITMTEGTFSDTTWGYLIGPNNIGNEIIWIDSWNATTGVLTITRGEQGTTASLIKPGATVYTLGDIIGKYTFSHPFKVAAGYWSAIKCVSGFNGTTGVPIQAHNLDGDNVTLDANNDYDVVSVLNGAAFVELTPGEIIYGKFNRVAIDEPGLAGEPNKIILYRG